MSVPRRLIEESELFGKLLADDRRERPSPATLPKLLETIDALPEDLGAPPSPPPSGVRKWLVLAGTALLVPAGIVAVTFATRDGAPAPSAPSDAPVIATPAANRTAEAPIEAAPRKVQAEGLPSVAVTSLPAVASTTTRSVRPSASIPSIAAAHSASPPSPASSGSHAAPSLRREVELIVAARRALTSGDANGCLSSVASYQREYPNGQFSLEAEVLRIEAMAASGERKRATVLARELLAREPENPYRARLRTLLTDIEDR